MLLFAERSYAEITQMFSKASLVSLLTHNSVSHAGLFNDCTVIPIDHSWYP